MKEFFKIFVYVRTAEGTTSDSLVYVFYLAFLLTLYCVRFYRGHLPTYRWTFLPWTFSPVCVLPWTFF